MERVSKPANKPIAKFPSLSFPTALELEPNFHAHHI